jgi:hypothetical protein
MNLTLCLANITYKVRISLIPINNLLIFNISATKTAIVLKELKDWSKWLAVTMLAAQEHDLVLYINPYKSKRDLVVLAQLIRPIMSNIQPFTAL